MNPCEDSIVVEAAYQVPIEVVWTAITDPQQMRQWFFETIGDFEPEPGFETQFTVAANNRDYVHLWNVTEVAPPRRIVYNWRYGGLPGDSHVSWELSETAAGTRLKLTHEGHETFPQDDPSFSRPAGEAGWRYFVCQSLKAFLENQDS